MSTRLDADHLASYYGSGYNVKEAIARAGSDGLAKRVLATAETQVELHYLEMISIAEARKDGATLLNGDLGGPRPFPAIQRALWNLVPEVMMAVSKPERFYEAITRNRIMVEQAIVDVLSDPVDQFYAGFERDVMAIEDLSYLCPVCGSTAGSVCRTNSRSLTMPHNPTWNHKTRPRANARMD
jgi:hypothetical protein